MAEFDGLVALVTGASSGIGFATVRELHGKGASIVALDREPFPEPHLVLSLQADVNDEGSLRRAVGEGVGAFGGLDILVNNAGIGAVGTVEDNADEEWHSVLDTNLLGIVRMMRVCLPHLRRSNHAAVVNVSSIIATTGVTRRACYSASKGAVLALTLSMAADLVEDQVRVNCVTPGTIGTPWVHRLLSGSQRPEGYRAALERRQPMGRLGLASEVAAAISFLASPRASFITGVALPVDGGLSGLRVVGDSSGADGASLAAARSPTDSSD